MSRDDHARAESDRVQRKLRAELAQLRPGGRLDTLRALSERHRTSKETLTRVLQQFQRDGLVTKGRGRAGRWFAATPDAAATWPDRIARDLHALVLGLGPEQRLGTLRELQVALNATAYETRSALELLCSARLVESLGRGADRSWITAASAWPRSTHSVDCVADMLCEWVRGVRADERLPSLHTLADVYGVDLMTVTMALRGLQGEGLVKSLDSGTDGGWIRTDGPKSETKRQRVERELRALVQRVKPGQRIGTLAELARSCRVGIPLVRDVLTQLSPELVEHDGTPRGGWIRAGGPKRQPPV